MTEANGTTQSPNVRSPRATPCRTHTNVTINIPTSDMPASEAMIRRGSSEAARVYSPTMPIRNPIWAGITAIDTSTTAIGHCRRNTSTEPASTPNTIPAATGIPASRANRTPSVPHSTADTTARLTSSAALRHLSHHHGPTPGGASVRSSPVAVIPPA